ncbi:MAG: GlxA family transcriptional regulator [Gemmobacter sp.]|uniref:GlxA family transcriptional regulator n=1 Tax=Gemmobacter sp. TaxID=1898957 RepID=UPI001A55810F|nr:GlxA family transcriptional regulator [Gemmobacter sp.]MBL8563760.1 GlxA family transcriptional regulator [Gemmobacter sp.]
MKAPDAPLSPPEDSRKFVARGVAHVTLPKVAEPVSVAFVLVPKFTLLAFTSAIEPLRVANQLTGQILFRWQTFSEDGQPVTSSCGVPVMTEGTLPEAPPAGYVLVCGGVEPETRMTASLADWLRGQWRRGRTVGGLCTGAYALARAGILKGRRFTLHWENLGGFTETFPDLTPARQVFCIEDRIVTCAGGVAAADLMLKLIHDRYGAQLSQEVMNMCLLTQRRTEEDEQITSLAARLGTRNEKLIKAVAFLEARIEEEFDLDACADHLGVSRRQIERLFNRYLGVTPVRYMNDLRLQHGRALLAETDMSVTEVAVACGYASSSHFSKSFRKKYGVSPYRFSHFGA